MPNLRWPWQCSEDDKQLIAKLSGIIKLWCCDFHLPHNLFDVTGNLKMHDWYVLCGGVGAYILLQCQGMERNVRDALIRYLFAVEALQRKMCDVIVSCSVFSQIYYIDLPLAG